jgi:hypothetical protein
MARIKRRLNAIYIPACRVDSVNGFDAVSGWHGPFPLQRLSDQADQHGRKRQGGEQGRLKAQKQHFQRCGDFILLLSKTTNSGTQFAFGHSSHELRGHYQLLTLNAEHRIQPLRRGRRGGFWQQGHDNSRIQAAEKI